MAISASKVLKFTRIHLENWRNFQNIDVRLKSRAFLVGQNASGKSNFLDAFRFLHDIVTVGGGFQEAIKKRGYVKHIRCFTARKYSDIEIHVVIGNANQSDIWEYKLKFNQDRQKTQIIKQETVIHSGKIVINRPDKDDEKDPKRLTQTYLEQINTNESFRPINEFFHRIKYLHIVPQLIREPDRSVGISDDPYGGDFLDQIQRTRKDTRKARFKRMVDALKVAVPQLVELKLERDEGDGRLHLKAKYENWRPTGQWQTEEWFSDGTLRLLGLLWAVQDGEGPLLLEEPELSLHPEIIKVIPQMFTRLQKQTGRQFIISTHSDALLHDRGIGLDELLLLEPMKEGTNIRLASSFEAIRKLVDGGMSLSDAVIPRTKPKHADQLIFALDK